MNGGGTGPCVLDTHPRCQRLTRPLGTAHDAKGCGRLVKTGSTPGTSATHPGSPLSGSDAFSPA
jgi:hypothetical protein